MDEELKAISEGMFLRERAVRIIEQRRYTEKPGDYWHVERAECGPGYPYYNGIKAVARLYATDDGTAYSVHVYSYQGEKLAEVVRKGLDAAFRVGAKLADEGVNNG